MLPDDEHIMCVYELECPVFVLMYSHSVSGIIRGISTKCHYIFIEKK